MHHFLKKLFCCLVLTLVVPASSLFALEVPPLKGPVNDLAGVLDAQTRAGIAGELTRFEQATGTQIAVLTIPSLEGEVLENYSLKVAETWQLGQKGKDNGALLLAVMQERKVRIEVGYGLEGTLTDLNCGRIIRGEMVSAFKKEAWAQGLLAGVRALMQTAESGTYAPSAEAQAFFQAEEAERQAREQKAADEVAWAWMVAATLAVSFVVGLLMGLWGLRLWNASRKESGLGKSERQKALALADNMMFYAMSIGAALSLLLGWFLGLLTDLWTLAALVFLGGIAAAVGEVILDPTASSGGSGSSSSSSSGSSSGGGYSGGGGRFGGGGASGSW